MPRTGENIYKRKDGRWEGRYIKTHLPSGKTVYGYLYARTYRDLKEKMLCQERLKNKPHLSSSPTFQTVIESFLPDLFRGRCLMNYIAMRIFTHYLLIWRECP